MIGDDSFFSARTFRINGLHKLTRIDIGKNSFTQKKLGFGNNTDKSFHIEDCENLQTISIGEFSFTDFGGEFVLKKLEKLTSISIGSLCKNSLDFYSCSFKIEGTTPVHTLMFV